MVLNGACGLAKSLGIKVLLLWKLHKTLVTYAFLIMPIGLMSAPSTLQCLLKLFFCYLLQELLVLLVARIISAF